tara:strand:- start:394 stop:729 length:336 start_codon:yes stop_codon:yes gene_type:complete
MKFITILITIFILKIAHAASNDQLFPDLSGLNKETRDSIKAACYMEKIKGPKKYAECQNKHLASIKSDSNNFFSDIINRIINTFVYYVQPILIIILFFLWRNQKKRNKKIK